MGRKGALIERRTAIGIERTTRKGYSVDGEDYLTVGR